MAKRTKTAAVADGRFVLEVPLDASQIEGAEPGAKVKVVAQGSGGVLAAATAELGRDRRGTARLSFAERPGPVRVLVGPADAADDELVGLQTLGIDVTAHSWGRQERLILPVVTIPPYYWLRWLLWCRTFTVHGHLTCPDGSPVPGAEVCAYDVDHWLFWSSTQLLGCATTDTDGAFSLTFRWCCGWWPWWWWRFRVWQIDPELVRRVGPVLERDPDLRLGPLPHSPSLDPFKGLLADRGLDLSAPLLEHADLLESLRRPLLAKLPVALELAELRLWPWWPWRPWWDCTPDLIFKATQSCFGEAKVILDEGLGDVRWDFNPANPVDLTASDEACCLPICHNPPCPEGECLVIDRVCDIPIQNIGGNLGAAPAPAGYAYPAVPAAGSYDRQRPFASVAPVSNTGTMVGIDYYEIVDELGNPLPPGTEVGLSRLYWDTNTLSFGAVPFPVTTISGHRVYESREHHEAASGLTWDQPGADRWWTSGTRNLLTRLDSLKLGGGNGTFRFKVVGWRINAGGNLFDPRPLPVCGADDDAELVLTFDNRTLPEPGHAPSHHCGAGVHLCTTEPDTHFLSVKVNGVEVPPCDTVPLAPGTLQIDFLAHDPGGHLAVYFLEAHYGLNQVVDLLHQPSSSLTVLAGGPQGPTYGEAVTLAQGATPPIWHGGTFRLTVDVDEAFPVPCCYLLKLAAWKRTIDGCDGAYPHRNRSEYTLGVGVCPQPTPPVPELGVVRPALP